MIPMMMNPTLPSLLAKIPNRYMIVNVAALRAREIAENAEREEIYLDDKPVSLALHEIANGVLHVVQEPGDAGEAR